MHALIVVAVDHPCNPENEAFAPEYESTMAWEAEGKMEMNISVWLHLTI